MILKMLVILGAIYYVECWRWYGTNDYIYYRTDLDIVCLIYGMILTKFFSNSNFPTMSALLCSSKINEYDY